MSSLPTNMSVFTLQPGLRPLARRGQGMVSGGYWILDDPMVSDCLGAAEAMEDLLIRRDGLNSEQVYPHYLLFVSPALTYGVKTQGSATEAATDKTTFGVAA
jgi:hypothetical protein